LDRVLSLKRQKQELHFAFYTRRRSTLLHLKILPARFQRTWLWRQRRRRSDGLGWRPTADETATETPQSRDRFVDDRLRERTTLL